MIMMKKTFLCLSLLLTMLLATTATAHASGDNALVVRLKSGASTTILLDKLPHATFSDGMLKVEGEGLQLSFARADVQRIIYTYTDPAGIASPAGQPAVRFTSEAVYVAGLTPGSQVGLYGADGRVVATLPVDADGCAVIPTGHLTRGIYLLHTDGFSHKFMKL